MSPDKRQWFLVGVMLLVLLVAVIYSASAMFEQKDRASRALTDLVACRKLTEQIQSLSARPTVASEKDIAPQELGQRVEKALKAARLKSSALLSINPQASRRMGKSPYVLKPTTLSFRNVTLMQLTRFLYELTIGTQMTVRDLRLRQSSGPNVENQWSAEATLTYLVYNPQ